MIPRTATDVDLLVEEARGQFEEVSEILTGASPEAARWRPDETRWSLAGHVAHLAILNRAYLDVIESRISAAEDTDAPEADGAALRTYRHPWVATRFVGMMEPPPRRRVRTFRGMVPDPQTEGGAALAEFERLQDRLAGLMDRSRSLDLGRVRFGSPFLPLLRFSLGTGFAMILAHNRRHVWLMKELMQHPDHPARLRGQ